MGQLQNNMNRPGMRELTEKEIQLVSGGSWEDIGAIVGGVGAVAAGTGYMVKTGGIGAFLGGATMVSGGMAAISSGFSGLHDSWYEGGS
ncbi:MAG: ABC transporter permease [Pseudomonadota bacterium]